MISITIQWLKKLPRLLIGLFLVLLVLDIAAIFLAYSTDHSSFYGLLDKFYFLFENNLPTYFSSVMLFIAAGLLFSIYHGNKTKQLADNKYWLFLSIFFLYLSIDEVASIHELLLNPISDFMTSHSISSTWLKFPWVIAGGIIAVVVALFFLRFYLRLPLRYKVMFGISAVLLAGGAIGMEIIDGHFYNIDITTSGGLVYFLLTTLEESMEMIGTILFTYSLINYMQLSQLETVITDSSKPKAAG
jgi:hypothetical protein